MQPGFIFARDTHILEPAEIVRLSAQAQRILERLQQGPATRRELTDIACNVTARISDLRAAGYQVVCEEHPDGRSVYRLTAKKDHD